MKMNKQKNLKKKKKLINFVCSNIQMAISKIPLAFILSDVIPKKEKQEALPVIILNDISHGTDG